MGKSKTVTTRTEIAGEEEEDEGPDLSEVALFGDHLDHKGDDSKRIVRIDISREDPEEGFLATVTDLSLSESQVFERWGGGKFVFFAKNPRGQVVTRKTLKVAGDPVFQSEVAEMRWRRANGLKPKREAGEATASGMSANDLMAIVETKAAELKRETEAREERRRAEDTAREEKLRREEREWRAQQEKDRADREERIRREDREHQAHLDAQRRDDDKRREDRIREDEQRREKEHERQIQAALLAAKESQEKNQQFFTNMLAMAKAGEKANNADPMAQVTQILTIVEALKGASSGEPQDAVTALLARLPETLQAAGSMVGGAIREAKGLPPQGSGDEDGGGGDDGSIRLTGAAAAKVKELVGHLVQKGQDPEKVLVAAADYLMGKRPGAAVRAAQAAGAKAKASKSRARRKRTSTAVEAKARVPNMRPESVPAKPAPTVTKPAGAP